MSIKTIPFREVEEKVENMYEAVAVMAGQARRELADRILSKADLDPKRRPQTFSLKEWSELYNSFSTFSIHTEQNLSDQK